MDKIRDYFLTPKPWVSLAVTAICLIIWILIKRGFRHFEHNAGGKHAANIRFGKNVLKYMLAVLGVITVLQINGINVTSLITGLGVAGVVVGFALEDLLKDIINGANIVWDNFYTIGDIVRYRSASGEIVEGKVTDFNLKATKIRDINTGNTVCISNRNISEIELLSDWVGLTVPAPYSVPAEKMREICRGICTRIEKLPAVSSCDFLGTQEFGESQINYRLIMHCPPEFKKRVRFDALGVIQDSLAENGIEIPFNRLDVNIKRD